MPLWFCIVSNIHSYDYILGARPIANLLHKSHEQISSRFPFLKSPQNQEKPGHLKNKGSGRAKLSSHMIINTGELNIELILF